MLRQVMFAVATALLTACAPALPVDSYLPLETTTRAPADDGSTHQQMLGRLVGRWVLSGEIAGQQTVHDVEATWLLQGRYVRITEVSREREANGLPAYEAVVYVGWLDDHYVCVWLDNTEVASGEVTCAATETADAIPFEFRDAAGALIFTNTFAYDRASDSWEWRMDNIRDGAPEPFARVTLRRAS